MARKQITQTQLADALGLAQSAVSRRINGHTDFTADEVGRVADLLGVPVAVLFAESAA
jgi:transcriptional regulator with XRE-family HTH domain